jgi:hypothetical protein
MIAKRNARFPIGHVVATPAAILLAEAHGLNLPELVIRHVTGDWGELDEYDKQVNENAVIHGDRILSAYGSGSRKLWIITESDRSVTTILTPEDY